VDRIKNDDKISKLSVEILPSFPTAFVSAIDIAAALAPSRGIHREASGSPTGLPEANTELDHVNQQ
jgi:hypothetical protein